VRTFCIDAFHDVFTEAKAGGPERLKTTVEILSDEQNLCFPMMVCELALWIPNQSIDSKEKIIEHVLKNSAVFIVKNSAIQCRH